MFEPIFPGVDPFIEDQRWAEFHSFYIGNLHHELARLLAPHYDVLAESYVHLMRPDVSLFRGQADMEPLEVSTVAVAEASRIITPTVYELEEQLRIEIYDHTSKLVTVIELLSPSNKMGKSRERYLANRDAILTSSVHLVEIDLLRLGKRTESSFAKRSYVALVARAQPEDDHQGELYEWDLPQPLPVIPIPLADDDPDIPLDLQTVFRKTYIEARYRLLLRYKNPLKIRFTTAERLWIETMLTQAGV